MVKVMGLNPGYLLKSFLLYEKNLFDGFVCFSVPTVQVEALVGQSCKLPCQMNSTRSSDVFLVLWYVDLDGKPIYR